jgi:hypothetical protein
MIGALLFIDSQCMQTANLQFSLPPFGYKTAEQLVTDGRTEDVLRYVSSLEAGVAGCG